MSRTLVTGATGNIGRLTLQHLLKRRPASDLVGLARNPANGADLAAEGIEIRQGDYFDHDGMVRALRGIDNMMLVSATAFTDRNTQHRNAISAAGQAGVQHIVYMPIIRKEGSNFVLPQVTEQDMIAQEMIEASGLQFTTVRHPPFLESIEFYIGGNALETGVHAPVGTGKAAFASRSDLAEAHAVVLSEAGHENKTYSLYGDPAVSFADVAQILSDISGKPVPFVARSDEGYIAHLVAAGLPEPAAGFALAWVHGINAGEWDGKTGDLEKLLGRKPTTAAEFLDASYAAHPD
ncbi:SDR family oxidoreductase [Tianweitania sediminis]|uniref:SDR family oxidoreductase n=1 Tax=Tianweitania sediminis TaxID=1502156 RepID=A0A8J7R0J2_9HYPH|nr:SDR family oxidoreductase [Tianweitania sediminis]MBP0438343.1 SDR family oxidoreductase [Tianweitania sediminis]